MKEAIGGIYSIQALVVFIILVMSLLAYSVNYTKSFKVKNELIHLIEQFEGLTEDSTAKIDSVLEHYTYNVPNVQLYENMCAEMGYQSYTANLPNGTDAVFCVKCDLADIKGTQVSGLKYKGSYYSVVTFVNIEIPIISQLFPRTGSFLKITGQTDLIYSSGNNSEICNQQGTIITQPTTQ